MIVSVASHKGGVGKTMTAIHLAAYLQTLAPTLLLDADETRNALDWSQDGPGLPFKVAPVGQAAKLVPKYAGEHGHIVIDTGQRPEGEDLREIVEGCDVLVIPAGSGGKSETRGLVQTVRALKELGGDHRYRLLLTMVPPPPEREAAELRKLLTSEGVPVFACDIPRLKAFKKAEAEGTIVNQVDDRNAARAWEAYQSAGRELTNG